MGTHVSIYPSSCLSSCTLSCLSCRRSSPSSALAWCPHWPWKGHHRRRAAGGQPTMHVPRYCRSDLIWAFSHCDQRLMRAFFLSRRANDFECNNKWSLCTTGLHRSVVVLNRPSTTSIDLYIQRALRILCLVRFQCLKSRKNAWIMKRCSD